MWRDSPVLIMVIFIRIIFLVICKETVQLDALLEVLYRFKASDMLQKFEIAVNIDAGSDESMPVDTL